MWKVLDDFEVVAVLQTYTTIAQLLDLGLKPASECCVSPRNLCLVVLQFYNAQYRVTGSRKSGSREVITTSCLHIICSKLRQIQNAKFRLASAADNLIDALATADR
jgi:hypothetical protein